MPKKRTTKINVRATPKVSRSTEGDKLSEKTRVEKMDVFLRDFDEKVSIQLKTMEDEKKRILQFISRRLHVQIMQLPLNVRKMTLREYMSAGGVSGVGSQEQSEGDKIKESAMFIGSHCETILEEQTQGAVPKPATGRRKKNGTQANTMKGQEHTSAIKSSFKTPYHGHVTAGCDTPIITPKFDPRLPYVSTNSRAPKPGERLVSLQGSPVAVFNKKGPSVKLRDDTLTMNLNLIENVNLDDMDIDLSEDHIQRVMTIFSQISSKLARKRELQEACGK